MLRVKVLIEAMCAQYGGIATYVENLIATWPSVYPEDELHVISSSTNPGWPAGVVAHRIPIRRPEILFRPIAQTRAVRHLVDELAPDVVLATLPSTTLRKPTVPTAVVIYDLRHELRPDHFPLQRRILRRVSYGRGYAIADGFIAISRRSLDDLHRLHPNTCDRPGSVAHLGADHVDAWSRMSSEPYAVAFGHHSNKNVDMVIEAWASLCGTRGADVEVPRLKVIGLSPAARDRMVTVIESLRLTNSVELLPFLRDAEFGSIMASARIVVFPSDFEGFGLPVVESLRLGIPVVVGPDAAVLEVAGGHATVMAEWSARALSDGIVAALAWDRERLEFAAEHGKAFTWARTVAETRSALLHLISEADVGQRIWKYSAEG
ncbi:MAG: glycosyltransferase [Actinomycetota bacterium]|nr:glycosyltransferase [Actinomycetota bacterium]